jgi:hypothetical protein
MFIEAALLPRNLSFHLFNLILLWLRFRFYLGKKLRFLQFRFRNTAVNLFFVLFSGKDALNNHFIKLQRTTVS